MEEKKVHAHATHAGPPIALSASLCFGEQITTFVPILLQGLGRAKPTDKLRIDLLDASLTRETARKAAATC